MMVNLHVRVTTGFLQGSPISPVLFAIYIADIHGAVEGQVEDSRGISFVDDVTWLAEGTNLNDVVDKLERCAEASLQWADHNAVRFETSKTEAVLFSKKRKTPPLQHWQRHPGGQPDRPLRVGDHTLAWDLAGLHALAESRRRRIGKTRQAEAGLRRIVSKYGAPPAAARNLQSEIVQGTMLYASELAWKGQRSAEDEDQLAIDRTGRATLSTFQSTPRGIIAGESGLTPARVLLNHR